MKSPFDILKEYNRRMEKTTVETPFDFLRLLNRERASREIREKLIKRVKRV